MLEAVRTPPNVGGWTEAALQRQKLRGRGLSFQLPAMAAPSLLLHCSFLSAARLVPSCGIAPVPFWIL
jgi:hypothetical protein